MFVPNKCFDFLIHLLGPSFAVRSLSLVPLLYPVAQRRTNTSLFHVPLLLTTKQGRHLAVTCPP